MIEFSAMADSVGPCDPKPNGTTNQTTATGFSASIAKAASTLPHSPQQNAKPLMRSSLITTTKSFPKGGGTAAQLMQLPNPKLPKPPVSTSLSSSGTKMISLQSTLLSAAAPIAGGVDTTVGSGSCVVSSAALVAQAAPGVISQTGTIAAYAASTQVPQMTTFKNFKNVAGHSASTGKMDSNTRYILNSSKPSSATMTVNLAPPLSGSTSAKVRYASINLTPSPHVPITSDTSQPLAQQQKVILQSTNQSGGNAPVPGTVVVSTSKVQPLVTQASSLGMSSPISSVTATQGTSAIRLSYPRRVGTQSSQHPAPQTFLPQQSTSARILHTGGIVPSSGNLPNLAPRMVLASPGSAGVSTPVIPVQTTSTANVLQNQTLQQGVASAPQGNAITVTQHDLQRLQQSGAIQPVTPTCQATGIAPVLAVRNIAASTTTSSASQQVVTVASGQQPQSGNSALEATTLMMTAQTSPLSALQNATQPSQPFVSRKRTELTLAPHPTSQHMNEGSIAPGRIITLHQATSPAGSTPQITLQTVAPHVNQPANSSTLFTQQLVQQQQQQQPSQQQAHQQQQRQGTAGTVVIQSSTVRPEASSSPMRKRARKQQLQTVATPVTTPMTVEEEEEQKRKSMYMMAVDRHQMARISNAGEPSQSSTGPPVSAASHSVTSNPNSDPSVSSVRLGARTDLGGSLDVPSSSVGNPMPLSASAVSGGNRYRANSAQSSTSSSGRSTPRLVSSSSQHRKRHSPRGHSSFATKLSRKSLSGVGGGKPSKRSRLSKVSSNVSSNATATASTSDTESDVEASVGVGGMRDAANVCIGGLLNTDDFHSPPTVTSNVRFGSPPLSQDHQHLVISSTSSRLPSFRRVHGSPGSQSSNFRKRMLEPSGMRSLNLSSTCVRQQQQQLSSLAYSHNSIKQALRRQSCEREPEEQMEEDTVLDGDIEVDNVVEEVEVADDEEDDSVWGVNEDTGDLGGITTVSNEERYTSLIPCDGVSPDMSSVGANVAVSSTEVSEAPDSNVGMVPPSRTFDMSDEGTCITGFRRMQMGYTCRWKTRWNHFQSYLDVRERKSDKKTFLANTVVSMAEKKNLKTMHWELLCLQTTFSNMKATEKKKLKRLERISDNVRDARGTSETIKELVKGNLQRSRLMIETISSHLETLEKFVKEQSKDMIEFLTPLENFCSAHSTSSSSNSAIHPLLSRASRHLGGGGGGSSTGSRTASGAHRNLS